MGMPKTAEDIRSICEERLAMKGVYNYSTAPYRKLNCSARQDVDHYKPVAFSCKMVNYVSYRICV